MSSSSVWRHEHEITRAIDRNEGLRRMNVPLHLHRRKRERLRLDCHHRKSHPRGRPAVLQLLDELLPSVPRRLGRNKLAERHERRRVDRCNFKTHHEAISQGCSVSQRRAMSSRLRIQTSALPLALKQEGKPSLGPDGREGAYTCRHSSSWASPGPLRTEDRTPRARNPLPQDQSICRLETAVIQSHSTCMVCCCRMREHREPLRRSPRRHRG